MNNSQIYLTFYGFNGTNCLLEKAEKKCAKLYDLNE